MTPSVVYAAKARKDVDREWRYLYARSGVELADRFLSALNQTSKQVAATPAIGTALDFDLPRAASVRRTSVNRPIEQWLLFYIPTDQGILVYRIAHGARDLPTLFQ